jgi:predicted ribosomally synthesized peptide with SipW-like signal peptide
MKNLKAKLFLLVLPVVLAAALVGGATMALFTDQAVNANNTFTAGTVDIGSFRATGDTIPGPMFYTTVSEGTVSAPGKRATGLWYPGRKVSRNLSVFNQGSLQVRLHRVSAEITSINGDLPANNPALAASFANNMHVKIFEVGVTPGVLYEGSLAALLDGEYCVHRPVIPAITPPFPPPTSHLLFEVTMLTSAGNDLQGIRPVVSFSVHAVQTKNNP